MHRASLRFGCILVLLAGIVCLPQSNGWAAPNPRYASLVIDADTGAVLHAENANAIRYPASLTKMMTLYLTFDKLHRGEWAPETMLTVSQKAASMPQTNIFLRAGDRISVQDAIKALVVRSANDVAVVLGEGIAGSEWKFGLLMTSKAHELGMTNTVFRNASGLPDSKQHSTARDLAMLGVALRKHFPEYYHYFNLQRFVWKGRTYTGHNRVLSRISGADGIKTGFINASGFNLVTSVRRGGHNLVAVVLGGRTARTRDDHMVSLMDRTFAKLGTKENVQFAGTIPLPKGKPGTTVAQLEQTAEQAVPVRKAKITMTDVRSNSGGTVRQVNTGMPKNMPFQVTSAPQAGQFRPVSMTQTQAIERQWGIQVGAYEEAREALIAAANAMNLAVDELTTAKIVVSDSSETGRIMHRARLANLTETQARSACKKIIARSEACFVYKANAG